MSSYSRHYENVEFNPQPEGASSHVRDKRTWDVANENNVHVSAFPKRPKLPSAVLSYVEHHALVKLSHDAYTVGWVCALPLEMAAATAMLDDMHQSLDMNPNDSNQYTFGNIGPHNIVIACLPSGQYGVNSAAIVANNMRWSFPSISIGLMVGIGGGVPGKVDVRLGDVVVSNPTADSPGVVQYDFGKAVHNGLFERIGVLNKPPQSVLTAVSQLRASHERQPSQIPAILADMEIRNPYMWEYSYRSVDGDRLFKSSYEHAAGDTCDGCDASKLVERDPRQAASPKVHYGIIASGNQVMKNAQTRDRIAKDLGIICFEMEAAGLMDNFPCLVVRGICDYSDSHKAKRWQRYAAATAAAYAKELLSIITPQGNHCLATQPVVLDNVQATPSNHRKILLDLLKFNQINKRQTNIKAAHAKTCEWLLEHPDYTDWINRQKYSQHHGFLWIRGKPGAGKSTLMNFAFLRARRRSGPKAHSISFFFNARGKGLEKSTLGMYRSLLYQLLEKMPDLQVLLDDTDLSHVIEADSHVWDLDLLRNLFRNAIRKLDQRQLTCFIDALDECDETEVWEMVKFFEDLGQYAVQNDIRLYVCFSSRHYPYIDIQYGQKLILEDQIGHGKDLADYVRSKLKAGSGPKSDQVIAEILRKASGVFMWVVLVVDILNKEYRGGRLFAVEKRLKDIPSKLSELFQDILTRDQQNMDDLLLCIQWLLYSKRPLTREEYYFALSSGLGPGTLGEWGPEDITYEVMDRLILSSSKGLAETTRSDDKTVQFIHESVRDFLLKDNGLHDLWPEMGDDFEGKSHDRLKNCCHTYSSEVNISTYLPEDEFLLKVSKKEAEGLRDQIAERFPFLEYATNQVLYHADAAIQAIPQDEFIRDFVVDHWIQRNNLFEQHKTRRHKPASTSLLYIAATKGLTRLVKTSLHETHDADVVGGRYTYPLLAAMNEGHEDSANALLDCTANKSEQKEVDPDIGSEPRHGGHASPSLNIGDEQGRTPLYFAAQWGQTGIARRLFDLGVNPNFYLTKRSANPLVRAAEKGKEAFVRFILHERTRSKPSPASVTDVSTSASSNENHDGKKKQLDLDAETLTLANEKCDEDVYWALDTAARTGDKNIARLLLGAGADINSTNDDGDAPLHIACVKSKEAMVELLLDAGADLNLHGRYKRTPLHYACNARNAPIAKLLIEAGASLESVDEWGDTPLHNACLRGALAAVEELLKAGTYPNAVNEKGDTPLHKACEWGNPESASLLIKAGANVQATNKNGKTPLFDAVRRDQLACVEILLSHGADINHRDNSRRTPIFDAVQAGSYQSISKMVQHGADLDATDDEGWTPLSLAIDLGKEVYWKSKSFECVRLLLESGADATKAGPKGEGLLDMAVRLGREDVLGHLTASIEKRHIQDDAI